MNCSYFGMLLLNGHADQRALVLSHIPGILRRGPETLPKSSLAMAVITSTHSS